MNNDQILGVLRGAAQRGVRALDIALMNSLLRVNLSQYDFLVSAINRVSTLGARTILPGKKARASELVGNGLREPMSKSRELHWARAIIKKNSELISRYVERKSQYQKSLISGDYIRSEHIMDEIEQLTGQSLWLIERRISLLQLSAGLKEQKDFSSQLARNNQGNMAALTAALVSERCEESVSIRRFALRTQELIKNWGVPDFVSRYLEIKLTTRPPQDELDVSSLLSIDSQSSVVDYYESYIQSLTFLLKNSLGQGTPDRDAVLCAADAMSFGDERLFPFLNRIYSEAGMRQAPDREGMREYKCELCEEIYDLYIAAVWNDPIPVPEEMSGQFGSLARDFAVLLRRDVGYLDSLERVQKKAALLSRMPLGDFLSAVCRHFQEPGISSIPFEVTPRTSRRDEVFAGVLLYAPPNMTAGDLVGDAQDQGAISEQTCKSAVLRLRAVSRDLCDGRYESALERASDGGTENSFYSREFSKARVTAAVGDGDLVLAIAESANILAESSAMRIELPLKDLFYGRKWRDFSGIDAIDLGVCLASYLKDNDDDNAAFMLRACVRAASLRGDRARLESMKEAGGADGQRFLAFFLEAWRGDYLELLPHLDTYRKVQEERILVCQKISSFTPEYAKSLDDEIRNITFEIALDDGIRHIDQSRLYVNTDGILRWAKEELGEAFERWIGLATLDTGETPDPQQIIRQIIEKSRESLVGRSDDPTTEADRLLVAITQKYLLRFYLDGNDGLDGYLSLRVRHGSLAGILRGCFEAAHLVTSRASDGAEYQRNVYWESRLGLSHERDSALQEQLAQFSRFLDETISKFVSSSVQIRSTTHPKGIIAIPQYSIMAQIAKSALMAEPWPPSIEDLAKELNANAGEFLKVQLKALVVSLRSEVESPVVERANLLIQSIDADEQGGHSSAELRDAITRAITAYQQAISRMAEWFRYSESTDILRTFSPAEVIQIAVKATKNIRVGFNPDLTIEIDPNIPDISASTLTHITDALCVLFENIHKHSLAVKPRVKASMTLLDGRTIKISVSNNLGSSYDYVANQLAIDEISSILRAGAQADRIAKEGRSGLVKLSRYSAGVDRQVHPRPLSFSLDAETGFEVTLLMQFRTLELKEVEQ